MGASHRSSIGGFLVSVFEKILHIVDYHDFEDWASKTIERNGRRYRVSLNDEAVRPALFPRNILGRFLCVWLPVLLDPYHPRRVGNMASPVGRFIAKKLIIISRFMPSSLRKRIAWIMSILYEKVGSKDVSWIVPIKYFSDLSTMNFYGLEVNVPAQAEEYLAYRYGKDWRVPKREWVTVKCDGAIRKK